MLGVLSAERAILTAFKTIGSILLILDRIVVSLLALVTSQGDFDSVISHTFRHLLYYLSALRSGHLPPCVDQEISSGAKICARKKTSHPTGIDKYTIVKTGGQVFSLIFQNIPRLFNASAHANMVTQLSALVKPRYRPPKRRRRPSAGSL